MHSSIIVTRGLGGALLCLCGATFAAGQAASEPAAEPLPLVVLAPVAVPEPAPALAPAGASTSASASASANASASPNASERASTSALDQARGGAEIISNEASLSGVVSNNSASQVTTGANIIQSNSFANASGIPVVIQNSGANVLIQNATVINLQLK